MAPSFIPTRSLFLASLMLVFFCSSTDARSDRAEDCCLAVSRKPIPKHVILGYRKQVKGEGCSQNAVVFITRRGKNLCAPTPSEEEWVDKITVFLDKRLKNCKENMFSGKRCHALKQLLV